MEFAQGGGEVFILIISFRKIGTEAEPQGQVWYRLPKNQRKVSKTGVLGPILTILSNFSCQACFQYIGVQDP